MMFLVCRFYHIQFKGIIERILSMGASSLPVANTTSGKYSDLS